MEPENETRQDVFRCSICAQELPSSSFSKTQAKKGNARKCTACVGQKSQASTAGDTATSKQKNPVVVTKVSLEPRPQKAVPGLEGLTVCTDWPKTKSGQPPGAQSAIYTPLLACAMGQPISEHCTAEQLETAAAWWTAALPAWPRWMAALTETDLGASTGYRDKLLSSAKGQPNALIFKAKGHGT